MPDGKVLVLVALLGLGYEFYEEALKPAIARTVHAVEACTKKVAHIVRKAF